MDTPGKVMTAALEIVNNERPTQSLLDLSLVKDMDVRPSAEWYASIAQLFAAEKSRRKDMDMRPSAE